MAAGAGERLDAALALVQIIAAETSLLALDAAIQAARGSADGPGSAAAAADVRALAAQMTKAADRAQHVKPAPATPPPVTSPGAPGASS